MNEIVQDARTLKRLIEEKDYVGLESYLVDKSMLLFEAKINNFHYRAK